MFNKVNKISVAVAAALFSSAVLALAPTEPVHLEVWMSGSSSQDNGIARLIKNICVVDTDGTLDTYKDGTLTPLAATGKKHLAYFCTVDRAKISDASLSDGGGDGALAKWAAKVLADPTLPANPNVLFHKSLVHKTVGGSVLGVSPVILAEPIDAMVVNNTNCVQVPPATDHLYSCDTTTLHVSDAGVSDVNPGLFVGANAGPWPPVAPGPNSLGRIEPVTPGAALLFGIPVSLPLYRALQYVQGKIPTAGTIDDSEAAMPSLSKEEVASIMTNRVKNWNNFKVGPAPGTGLRDYYASLPGVTTDQLPFNPLVNICRRTNGSGTQAQMSAKFLNYPCTPGASAPTETSNRILGTVVYLGASSGDVDTCLDIAGTLGNAAAVPSNVATGVAGSPGNNRWAVGLQSLEKNFLVGGVYPLNYRFVKIDNVAPTLANAANGKYLDWVETTYQWRKVPVEAVPALTGDELDLVSTIANNAGKADIVRTVVNPDFVYSFGQSGYLALDATIGTNAPTYPFVATNPVTPYTHTIGGGVDNCRTPVILTTGGM